MEFNKVLPEALPDHKISRTTLSNDKAFELVGLIEKGAATPDIGVAFLQEMLPKFTVQPGGPAEKSWPPIYQTGVLYFDDPSLAVFLADITAEMRHIDMLYLTGSSGDIKAANDAALGDRLTKLAAMLNANEKDVLQRAHQYEEFCKAVRRAGGRFDGQRHDGQGRHAGNLFMDNVSDETLYILTEINRQLTARINDAERKRTTLNQKTANWGASKDPSPYLIRRLKELSELRRALLENIAQRKSMTADAERTRYELMNILCWTDGAPEVERNSKLPPLDPASYLPARFANAAQALCDGLQAAIEATAGLGVAAGNAAATASAVAIPLGANGKPIRFKKDGTPWPTRKPAKKAAGKRVAASKAPKTATRKGAKAKRGQKPVRLKNDGTPWGVRKPAKAK